MDPNLTYPIILNPLINATLNPAPSNVIKDWLPSIISIVVVIIGGAITYLSTIRIEEQKHQYDLKKEVYFDVMRSILEYKRRNEDFEEAAKELERLQKAGILKANFGPQQKVEDSLKNLKDSGKELQLYSARMQICATEEVYKSFIEVLSKIDAKNQENFNAAVSDRLIPAMKSDLMKSPKPFWQIWK